MSSLEDYVISRRGADYVLYEGLLAEAHRQGLKAILTRLVQAPTPENGRLAICAAEIHTNRGTFTALGEARFAPSNRVPADLGAQPTLVALAETRAKARALRDAVGAAPTPIDDQELEVRT